MSARRPLAVALAAGALTALSRWTPLFDPDAFWHLHTGRFIATQGAIPWVDRFSHTAQGRAWRFIDVASDVALYGAWSLGSYTGVIALTVALGFAAAALSVLTQARALGDARVAPLIAVAPWVASTLAFRLTPRPQTFAFVALAALLYLVVASRARPRLLWLAPLVVGLWQNLHASGPLGVLVVGAVAAGAALDRRDATTPGAVTALSALALLACPHPLARIAEGVAHVADPRLAALISEWQPLWRLHTLAPAIVALGGLFALALLGAVQRRERRPDTALLLIAAGVSFMALRAVRFVPLAGLALAPVAAFGARRVLDALRLRRALAAALALAGIATLYAGRKPFGAGVNAAMVPVGAADFVARTHPAGNLVHDFEMGGYLMWTLGPRHPVFVDGRSWALYDTAFLLDALQLTGDRLVRLVPRYDLRVAVLWTEARVGLLQREGWHLVYLDDVASVLVRAPDDAPYVARYGYRELHPARWSDDLTRLAADPAALARAERESERMVREAPQSSLAWVLRATVEAAAGRATEADASALRAVQLRPDLTPPHRMLMLRCAARDDRACVCAESAAVRARAPRNEQAAQFARRYGCP